MNKHDKNFLFKKIYKTELDVMIMSSVSFLILLL